MVHDHKVMADQERCMRFGINGAMSPTSKSCSVHKRSQKKPNSCRNNLTNYFKRRKQSNCLQYHGLGGLKRDVGQTGKYMQQDRPRSGLLDSLKILKLPKNQQAKEIQ